MAKRLTKQELEQDPLLDSYAKVQRFYEQHKNLLIGLAAAVVLAVGLSIGYYYYNRAQEREAQQLMGYAEQYYLNGNYQQALRGSEEDFTVGFEQIIDNYSNTKAGNLALYYAAVSEYNLGNTEQALSYMEDYEIPEGILGVAPLSFKGVLLMALGNYAEAAQVYVKAATWDLNESTTPNNLLEAAYAYIEAGNREEARAQAERIIADYPNSSEIADAKRLLGRLQTASN